VWRSWKAEGLAKQASAIFAPGQPLPKTADGFINQMIWLFIVITALLCLPASFEKDA
jgi:hypothetical protein